MRRGLGLGLGLLVGLALAEAGVRLRYQELPSSAGLDAIGVQRATRSAVRCGPDGLKAVSASAQQVDEVWVIGDSVIAGHDVPVRQRVTARVGDALGLAAPDMGMPGADHCVVAHRALEELATRVPARVVLGVFADDLDTHELVRLRSGRVASTGEVPAPARASWLVNLAWHGWHMRAVPATTRAPHAVDVFRGTTSQVDEAFRGAGVTPLWVLMAPVGPCDRRACAQEADDADAMATQLDALGVEWLDVRGIWGAEHALPTEPSPIHPNAEGHRLLAGRLVEALRSDEGGLHAEDRSGRPHP